MPKGAGGTKRGKGTADSAAATERHPPSSGGASGRRTLTMELRSSSRDENVPDENVPDENIPAAEEPAAAHPTTPNDDWMTNEILRGEELQERLKAAMTAADIANIGAGYFGGNSEIAKIVWVLSALLVVLFMIALFVEAHMHNVDHAIIFRMTGFMMTSSVLCFARWRALWNGWPILANVSLSLLCLICSGGLVMIYFEGTDFVIHTVYGIDRQLDSLDESSNLTLFDFDFTWIDHIGDDGRSSRMNFYIMLTSVLCFVRWKGLWDDTSYERWFPEDLYPYVNWFTLKNASLALFCFICFGELTMIDHTTNHATSFNRHQTRLVKEFTAVLPWPGAGLNLWIMVCIYRRERENAHFWAVMLSLYLVMCNYFVGYELSTDAFWNQAKRTDREAYAFRACIFFFVLSYICAMAGGGFLEAREATKLIAQDFISRDKEKYDELWESFKNETVMEVIGGKEESVSAVGRLDREVTRNKTGLRGTAVRIDIDTLSMERIIERRKLVWEQLGKIDNMFKTRNYHEVPEEFRDGDEHVKPSFTQQTNYDLLLIAFCASFYLLLPKDWKSLPRMSELRTKATRTVYQIPFHTSLYDARTLLKEETCELLTAIMYQYQNTPRPAPSPTDGQPEAIRVAQRLAEAARGTHTFFPKPRQLINSLAVLYKQAYLLNGHFQENVLQWAQDTEGASEYVPTKKSHRAIEKICRSYSGDASYMIDLVRASITYPTIESLTKGLIRVKNDPHVAVLQIKNRLHPTDSSPTGYRNVSISLVLVDKFTRSRGLENHVCELQLELERFVKCKLKMRGHARYVEWRNLNAE